MPSHRYIWRDAVTGKLVTEEYALAHASTTIKEKVDTQESDIGGDLYIDDKTMQKVHDALERAGITSVWQRVNIITEMQNAGILFRERGRF